MALYDDLELGANMTRGHHEAADLIPDALELIERQDDRSEATDIGAFADGIEPLTLGRRP